MPTAAKSINIVLSDATGSVATRSYSDMCILGDDGHKVETFTPRGVANAAPVVNLAIDGISQFEGLVNESKELIVADTPSTLQWNGGEVYPFEISKSYTLYDSDVNNFILVTIAGTLPASATYDVTIQDGVLADQITVLELDDELLTAAPVITDAAEETCAVDGVGDYPRPTSTKDYIIYTADKSLIAIKNTVSPTPVVDISVDYSIYKIARPYTSLTAVDADHKSGTEISKTAAKMFANGARTVSVMNAFDGALIHYDLCLTELETQNYDYDIMVPTMTVGDGDGYFDLCAAHAITYNKIIIAPVTGTATVVREAWGGLTLDEGQYGICYNDTTYSVGELAGAAAAVIAKNKPWIPCEWGNVSGINTAVYSQDDLNTIEGTYTTMGGNTFIAPGASTVLSSGRGLKAGSFIDLPRTKLYLKNATQDAWVTAKLVAANSNKKIPYTAAGLMQVKNILRKPLMKAQRDGALRATSYGADGTALPGFVISMPAIENIPLAYKAARQLPDVEITAYLSGAISVIDPLQFTISLGEA